MSLVPELVFRGMRDAPSSGFMEDDNEQIVHCLKHVRDVSLALHAWLRDLNGLFLFWLLTLPRLGRIIR
jgi:hypothetical protein